MTEKRKKKNVLLQLQYFLLKAVLNVPIHPYQKITFHDYFTNCNQTGLAACRSSVDENHWLVQNLHTIITNIQNNTAWKQHMNPDSHLTRAQHYCNHDRTLDLIYFFVASLEILVVISEFLETFLSLEILLFWGRFIDIELTKSCFISYSHKQDNAQRSLQQRDVSTLPLTESGEIETKLQISGNHAPFQKPNTKWTFLIRFSAVPQYLK